MRTATRFTVTTVLLGTALLAATGGAVAATAGDPAYPAPSKQEHTYSIPVGTISDLGDLTKVANLGTDFAALLGH
ncbi:hypothetical protein [Kitasatospora kifunensis]|uniref:Secreted protein n=1 Tax=Kitasatospora kifunensis TaxID=58351 RepID=A0A7W7R877_KITKI|nr:hypothetical protein [Kitasatospora kifunensis]MBB4927213.1 hypothetical protein [Kitasatospora kifunensis]